MCLLDGTHQGSIVITHNLQGFDGFLLCEYFYKECLPKLVLNGAKIMSMGLEEAQIKFCDSLNCYAIESLAKNLWSYRT